LNKRQAKIKETRSCKFFVSLGHPQNFLAVNLLKKLELHFASFFIVHQLILILSLLLKDLSTGKRKKTGGRAWSLVNSKCQ
jgi:hypothetical protein